MFYTEEELVEREAVAANVKASLAEKSATSRKFDLLNVSLASDSGDRGTEFVIVDMEVLCKLFASATCSKCWRGTFLRREGVRPCGEACCYVLCVRFYWKMLEEMHHCGVTLFTFFSP